jgi:hypothetical protein
MKKNYIYAITIVNHLARIGLDLTLNEYCMADLIYQISNNPKSTDPGWCYASKKYIADCLGINRQHVYTIIERLVELGLVEKHPVSERLRATDSWYENVVIFEKDLINLSEKPTLSEKCRKNRQKVSEKPTTLSEKPTNISDISNDITNIYSAEDSAQGVSSAKETANPEPPKPPVPPVPPQPPKKDKVPLEKLRTVMLAFKISSGAAADDKNWDKTEFRKWSGYGKEMLIYFALDDTRAVKCIEEMVQHFLKEKLSWTPAAVARWKADWNVQNKKFGRYLGFGRGAEAVFNDEKKGGGF